MHALLPQTAGRCLGPAQLRSQRASSTSRPLNTSICPNGALQTPWGTSLHGSSSSSRLHSSQSQADVADQYPEIQPFSAVDSTVEALLTAGLEAEGEEPPGLEALVAATARKANQQAADRSQDENPYSPEDALRCDLLIAHSCYVRVPKPACFGSYAS
jgi:hypothetical protein